MREPVTRIKRINDYKKNYGLRLQIGYIGSLSIFLILFNISISSDPSKPLIIEMQEEVFVEEVAQTKQITIPPSPPRPPVPIEVPNDEILDDDIVDLDLDFELDGPINLPPPPPQANNDEEEIFIVVEGTSPLSVSVRLTCVGYQCSQFLSELVFDSCGNRVVS